MKTITWCFRSVKMQDGGTLVWGVYTKEVTTKASQGCEHLPAPVPAVPAGEITAAGHTAPSLCRRSLSCTAPHVSFA